ncbi:hypothetical protein MMC20_002831 [Loxospora ochrophaea]|nr:hypothetical protein [Loxospora ochrophaea]
MGYLRSTDTEPPSCGEVLLFDSSMSVILETGTDGWTQNGNLCSYETHTLEDFGSAVLRRRTNDLVFTSENSPLYMEMVHLIVAKAILFSRNMHRLNSMTGKTDRSIHSSQFWNLELELYRLSDTAQIIFASYSIDFKSVERFVARIQGLPLLEIPIGNKAEAFLKSAEASLKLLDPSTPAENREWFHSLLDEVAQIVLAFAHVKNVRDCVKMPLILDIPPAAVENSLPVDPTHFPEIVTSLLMKPHASKDRWATHNGNYLVSERGWSIHLDCIGDQDPSDV